jgi:hypothetical protein
MPTKLGECVSLLHLLTGVKALNSFDTSEVPVIVDDALNMDRFLSKGVQPGEKLLEDVPSG